MTSSGLVTRLSEPIEEQTTINLHGCHWKDPILQLGTFKGVGGHFYTIPCSTMVNTVASTTSRHHGEQHDNN